MSDATSNASAFLHNIEKTEGRSPTPEETDEAVRMRRREAGQPEYPEEINKYNRPYQSMVGDPEMSEEGERMMRETNLTSEEILADDYAKLKGGAEEMGVNLDPLTPPSMDMSAAPVLTTNLPPSVSASFAFGEAQRDALISGDTRDQADRVEAYRSGVETVEDEMIAVLEASYGDAFVDQGVLNDLEGYSDEEKISRITSEYMRKDAQKQHVRNLIGLNLLRQGLGKLPVEALDRLWVDTTPGQAQALYDQYQTIQLAELNKFIDRIAADQAFEYTEGVTDIIRQDIIPILGAATRVAGTLTFVPEQVDIGILRKGLPGEVRQEIREWWVAASHEERVEYVAGIEREWAKRRKGPNSGLYTKYLVIENLMGIFNDKLLYDNDATDSFDRVMGNLDTLVGAIIGVGLFVKRGKSIFDMWGSKKENINKQLAEAGGSRAASAELDDSLYEAAEEWGYTIDELSVDELVKPHQLELDFGTKVELDRPRIVTPNAARAERVMNNTEQAEVTLLSDEDKVAVIHREAERLASGETIKPITKMSHLEVNETSITFDNIFGNAQGEGWKDLQDLLDDMKDVDPYQEFTIYRRGKHGELEQVDITFADIVEYRATGRVPKALDDMIEKDPEWTELARFFGGRRVKNISNEELKSALDTGWIPVDSIAYLKAQKILNDRAAMFANPRLKLDVDDPMALINGEELFVRFKSTHYYDADDIQNLEGAFKWWNPVSQFAWRAVNRLIAPNAKFDSIYKGFLRSYHMEENALMELNNMMKPFDDLGAAGKQEVNEMMEWVEQYAKDMHEATGTARAPTTFELRAQFPNMSVDSFNGYMALLDVQDTMYKVLNRRMYRDFTNKGHKTMRATNSEMPNYHGKPLIEPGAGHYYDPVKNQMVEVGAEEMADIVQRGGGVLELDIPVKLDGGGRYTHVLARPDDYKIGKLSERPLKYHQGYHFRFYEDPYYVVRVTEDAVINGVRSGEVLEEAVATAGSWRQATKFLGRKYQDTGKGTFRRPDGKGGVFKIVHSKDINNTEGTLYANSSIHYEGRMFWDERGNRLPDVHGNRAEIADPTTAMQKGIAMAMRQATQEGLMKTLKSGFYKEFSDLPKYAESKQLMQIDDLKGAEDLLKKGRNESFGATRGRYSEAISVLRYMRSQMGVDSAAVPFLRQKALWLTKYVENILVDKLKITGGQRLHRRAQLIAMKLDPFSRARKIAYGAFMVLRPARQALLQSAQITMLTGLAPGYIGTGKIFFDAAAIRRGIRHLNKTGVDDGWSSAKLAKAMGWSKKEYNRVVEELQRSGILGTVNTHANNSASKGLNAQLDPKAGRWGRFTYNAKVKGNQGYNTMSRLGFELGERNNLTFTYLVALRRVKKRLGKDTMKLTRQDWDAVAQEADALALAMTRPNKFMYQSGFTGTLLQFLSFQHRAALTLLGMNPAMSKADLVKVWFSTYALWGGNMFGAEDWTREFLSGIGLTNNATDEIFPGVSLQDVLAEGFIEVGLNLMITALKESGQSDINFGIMAPGAAIVEIYRKMYDVMTKAPLDGMSNMMGPSGQPIGGFMKGMKFMVQYSQNETKTPGEKLIRISEEVLRNTLPAFNDANRSWIAYQSGEWLDKDGDTLEVNAAYENIIARLGFGLRTNEEMATYRMRTLHWENRKNVNDFVEGLRHTMKQIVKDWAKGDRTDEQVYEFTQTLWSLTEGADEGIRQEIYERVLTEMDDEGESIIQILAESHSSATAIIGELAPYFNQQAHWTPEQRRTMIDTAETLSGGWKARDQEFNQIMKDQKRED
jgi:hypothetical protein